MAITLDVPLVRQSRNADCWYAAGCMVAYYRRPGPRLGIPEVWQANVGLPFNRWAEHAANEGFREVPWPNSGAWSPGSLEAALTIYGPLLCHGRFYFQGHAIALTGVDGNTICLNDPWEPAKKMNTLEWFNTNIWAQQYRPMWYCPR